MAQYERVIIDLVESATRTIRTAPLVLGGNGGAGGGVGTPPGGFVGQLPQYRVSYDTTEAATLATLPSGVAGISGWSLVDNLNHIRYRLGILESGGSLIVTDDNNSIEYSDTTNIHFVGSGVVVTDLGGGDIQIEIDATASSGISESYADTKYLKLDATNDPLTGFLSVVNSIPGGSPGAGGIYVQTTGDALTADFQQVTDTDNIDSYPTLRLLQDSTGAGNLDAPVIGAWRILESTGTASGAWLEFHNADDPDNLNDFEIDKDGNAYTKGQLLTTDAPSDNKSYVRKNATWAALSGVSDLDVRYLKLDASNDPLTAQLDITPSTPGDGGIYISTAGDAFSLDVEQLTTNTNVTSPNSLLIQSTDGTGSFNGNSQLIHGLRYKTGAGVYNSSWIKLETVGSGTAFEVTHNGKAYSNGGLLITDAPSDNNTYGRKNGAWVAVSGIVSSGGAALTVEQYGGTPSISNADKIIFSGASVVDWGNGDAVVAIPDRMLYDNPSSNVYSTSPQEDISLSDGINYFNMSINTVDVQLGGINASNQIAQSLLVLKVDPASTKNLILKHNSAGSTYYFTLPNAQNLVLCPGDEALLMTDGSTWEVISTTATTSMQGIKVDASLTSTATTNYALKYDGSKLTLLPSRKLLTADITYYVRTDGNDSNTGLANTAGGAFLTVQNAIDTVAALDIVTYNVTIQIADGTYTTSTGNILKSPLGSGSVIIQGNASTPTNVVVATNGTMGSFDANFVATNQKVTFVIKNLRISSTASGTRYGILSSSNSYIEISGIDFYTGFTQHLRAIDGGIAKVVGDYTISGGAGVHIAPTAGIIRSQSYTVTISGTPNFTVAFVQAAYTGVAILSSMTYTGSATGKRYDAIGNGVINSGGGGATYFPGDASGTTATGGQYI